MDIVKKVYSDRYKINSYAYLRSKKLQGQLASLWEIVWFFTAEPFLILFSFLRKPKEKAWEKLYRCGNVTFYSKLIVNPKRFPSNLQLNDQPENIALLCFKTEPPNHELEDLYFYEEYRKIEGLLVLFAYTTEGMDLIFFDFKDCSVKKIALLASLYWQVKCDKSAKMIKLKAEKGDQVFCVEIPLVG
jgi:hypothetical protein